MGNFKSRQLTEKEKLHRQRLDHINALFKNSFSDSDNSMGQSHSSSSADRSSSLSSDHKGITRVVSMDEVDSNAMGVEPKDYEFHFENLVFEGGGNKGTAYCGAIRYLEELGLMPNIKRFAGASAGAMTAALLAVGYNSDEIEDFLSQNINDIFMDHSCGYFSLLPNLLRNYGWNPGNKIYEWFGNKLAAKMGNRDITFEELFRRTKKELCIVVTNLNQMNTEYCHAKTTPDMPIRTALRMSMAIPGVFTVIKYTLHGQTDVYVDGGLLCNYPIHCFDGWYLSLAPGDGFIQKLHPLKDLPRLFDRRERFGQSNEKTLGFLLYADNENDIFRFSLDKRAGVLIPDKPDPPTKLYNQRLKEKSEEEKAEREHHRVKEAVDAFLKVLSKHDLDLNAAIDREELENAFKDEKEFSREQAKLLFGNDVTVEKAFEILDQDGNGKIMHNELLRFVEETGICLQARFLGYQRKEVNSFVTFLETLQTTLLTNVKKVFVQASDLQRTVGINTGHVNTTDFVLEDADREFIIQRGYNSTKAYFQYHVVHNNLKKRQAQQENREDSPGSENSPEPKSSPETNSSPKAVEDIELTEKHHDVEDDDDDVRKRLLESS